MQQRKQSGIDADEAERIGADAARPTLGGLAARGRQRLAAGRQLAELARYAGAPLIVGTALTNLAIGAAPVGFLVGIGLALQRLASGAPPGGWLWLALGAFVLQQVLALVQFLLSMEIGRRVDTACITRFTSFALRRAPLRVLERPDVADRLGEADEAFEQWTYTPGGAVEAALALLPHYTRLLGAVLVIGVAAGPGPALAGLAVALVARTGQTEAFYRWGQLIRGFRGLRRRAAYLRELSTSTRAAKEIRTLGLAGWLDDRFHRETRAVLDPMWRWRRRVYGMPFVGYSVVALAGTVVALVLVGRSGGVGDVGRVAMAVQGIVLCARFGVMFPEADVKLVYGRSAWEALLEFEAIATDATAGEAGPAGDGSRVTPRSTIALDGVRFGYRPEQPVLEGLSLELAVGTSTALVGVNGAGKTTLVKLLAGLYRPDAGTVRVDGTDLRELDPDGWLRAFAITFQDYLRYELPLRDNVAMGSIEHRDDDAGILAELARVGLGDLVGQLPAGLDTPLTRSLPGGRELSGGQWQRLALARSLFAVRHGASVLVLDEPTAQLDARGEDEF